MDRNNITGTIVDAAVKIHRELGPGLLESVYETCLTYELSRRGLSVQRQVPIPVTYRDMVFNEGFRADLIVNNSVIVELKSQESVKSVHKTQVITYLKLSKLKLGLLLNFGEALMKNGITRVVC